MIELDHKDLRIDVERYAFASRPYKIKITHLPSGIWARGEGLDMYHLERELCYRILTKLAEKGKCDHIFGYLPGGRDNDSDLISESDIDNERIFRDETFELFNFCPDCGLPVGDIEKQAE